MFTKVHITEFAGVNLSNMFIYLKYHISAIGEIFIY